MPILFQCVNRILAYSPLKITKSPALSFRTQGNMLAMNPLLVEIGWLKQILNIAQLSAIGFLIQLNVEFYHCLPRICSSLGVTQYAQTFSILKPFFSYHVKTLSLLVSLRRNFVNNGLNITASFLHTDKMLKMESCVETFFAV